MATAAHPINTTTSDGVILSVKQAARKLGTTERTIRNYLVQKRNPLPHSKPVGKIMIHADDLEQWRKSR